MRRNGPLRRSRRIRARPGRGDGARAALRAEHHSRSAHDHLQAVDGRQAGPQPEDVVLGPLQGVRHRPVSIANKGKYGQFTVYLVIGTDLETEVTGLLVDAIPASSVRPAPGRIYWEAGTTLYGDKYWMAKRRYGDNVVLWWIGSNPVKKTDRTFKRLHTTLTAATR